MQEPYKRILEKRRAQLVEQIRWSRELATGLEKHGLLSKEDLRYVETEQSSQSRVYSALTRVIANGDPRAFGRFHQLLDELGNKSMAESLDFDRQRIRWEFDKEIHATCLPNYIDLVNAQLLDPALTEQDDYTRQCLISAAKRRLEELRNCIRQQQRDRDNFRAALWETITGTKNLTGSSSHSYRAKDTVSLSDIEDAESRRDEVLQKKTKALVELLRLRSAEHKRGNDGLLETPQSNDVIISPDKQQQLPQSVSMDELENDVNLVANAHIDDVAQNLTGDDFEIAEQQCFDGDTDDEKGCVRISRPVLDQILQILKPFEAHRSVNTRQKDAVGVSQTRGNADDPSVSRLIDLLQSMESELELWRNRSHRLSSELKSFEHERQLISTALRIKSTDRDACIENILSKIAELTADATVNPREIHQSQGVDDQIAQSGGDAGKSRRLSKSRRSSADEEVASVRNKTTETIVDLGVARNRRMSTPLMRPRPYITTELPILQEPQRNKNPFTYRQSSRDYGSVGLAVSTSNEQKMATGKFARCSYELNQFRRRGSIDGRPINHVAITAEPSATLTAIPNDRMRKTSVAGQRRSIDCINDAV